MSNEHGILKDVQRLSVCPPRGRKSYTEFFKLPRLYQPIDPRINNCQPDDA